MKYLSRIIILFSVLSGIWISIPSPGYGRELVQFMPHFALTGYYSDNVEFTPLNPSSDYYALISPGLGVRLNLDWLPITVDYTYNRYQYRERSDLNRDFHDFTIETRKALNISRNISVEIGDRYEGVPIDVGLPEDQPSNLTQRNRFYVRPVWEKRFSRKMNLRAGYEFSRVDYTSSSLAGDDYFGHRFFARWSGEIYRSLTLYQDNQYQMKYFETAPDYTQFLPSAGAHMLFGRNFTVDARYGYSFDKTGDKRHNGYVYSIVGGWVPTSKIRAKATFQRRRTTDIQGIPYTERYYELLLEYKPAKRLVLESYLRYYDYTYYRTDSKRISFKVGAIYRVNKWSSINAGYILTQNVDMPPEDTAKANRVYLGVNITI